MLKYLPLVACLAMTPAPAFADDAKTKANDDTKMVCKRVDGTGWRLSRSSRVCKTQAQWDAESRAARDEVQRSGRRDVS
jgi:hypothetical protein